MDLTGCLHLLSRDDVLSGTTFFVRMEFHMFIKMIITGLENPQAVPVLPLEMFHFLIMNMPLAEREHANCKLLLNRTATDCEQDRRAKSF